MAGIELCQSVPVPPRHRRDQGGVLGVVADRTGLHVGAPYHGFGLPGLRGKRPDGAMILRETGWMVVVGLVAGAALSAAGVQLIASRLYGLSAADPVSITLSVLILAAVAGLATWLPAYRASRVDPLIALRYE